MELHPSLISLQTVAIQGDPGSNSHLAAKRLLGNKARVVPCRLSADVVHAVLEGEVDCAVLPIENSLHGSVAEHYDLLLEGPLRIDGELQLRIEHHLIARAGTRLEQVHTVLSHPVALSQCRRFLSGFTQARAQPFYDTAGSVRHIIAEGLTDTAGLAPRLAAELYGGEILVANVEDHAENFTRFHLLRRQGTVRAGQGANKLSIAFSLEHRPGSLAGALQELAACGADLTKIESRPVPGRPWEYVFFVDLRYQGESMAEAAMAALQGRCHMLRELGRYVAAEARAAEVPLRVAPSADSAHAAD